MAIINPTANEQPEPESTTQDGPTNALDSRTSQQEQPTTTTVTSIESDPPSAATTTSKEEPDPLTQNPEPDVKPTAEKWPGWPGYNAFRFIVPRTKAGRIIGSKGDFIEKLCKDTRAKVQVLDASSSITDRVNVMVVLHGGVPVVFAGTEAPAAFAELISLGGLGQSVNAKLSSTIADILQTKLSIDSSRFYIKFFSSPRQFVGFNGSTF